MNHGARRKTEKLSDAIVSKLGAVYSFLSPLHCLLTRKTGQKQKDRVSQSQSMEMDTGSGMQFNGACEDWAGSYGVNEAAYPDYMTFEDGTSLMDHAGDMVDIFPVCRAKPSDIYSVSYSLSCPWHHKTCHPAKMARTKLTPPSPPATQARAPSHILVLCSKVHIR